MGLLCAEGSAYVGKTGVTCSTRFSFNSKEQNTLAKDVVDFFSTLGFNAKVYIKNKRRTSCTVHVGGQGMARILYDQVGVGVTKKIPWTLIGRHHAEFLDGLFKGDGHVDRVHKKVSISLVAKELILGAQSMLWGLGIYPTVQFTEKREHHREFWSLILQAENYSKFLRLVSKEEPDSDGTRIYGDDQFVYRKFQKLTPVVTSMLVYNLETTGTHSYIANGLSVHNCQYCGNRFPDDDLTFDHVVPECRGGKTWWTNIVTACGSCNSRKDDRTPEEAGMPLLRKPKKPSWLPGVLALLVHKGEVPTQWADWIDWLIPIRHAA
jgi:5-methylcytosine-specific restriction endonuclease McrA